MMVMTVVLKVSDASCRSCSRDPTDSILARVKSLGQTFREHYSKDSEDSPGSHIGTKKNSERLKLWDHRFHCFLLVCASDFAENRWKLAEILYYKILENVLVQESKRLQGRDMSVSSSSSRCSWFLCSDPKPVCLLTGSAGAGHLPLLPDGLLPGGGAVLLQLPEDLPLDHPRLQAGPLLLLQGNPQTWA